jgi:serine/threonine protein kinase
MDRFRLVERVGKGAMADVYRAHDVLLDRPVAVKLFRTAPDDVAQHRFDMEAQALARLSHPGLVSIYATGVREARPYLVMQLVDGPSLQSRLRNGPMSLDATARLGAAVASALAHAHANGVLHRDVKPSNILLDRHGSPHLTDFGIALVAGATRMTATDEILGTPAYLAPEQVLGSELGPAVDVYSLGLVLLECVTGTVEFSGGSRMEAALARLHRPARIPPGLPSRLVNLLSAMTAYDPTRRPTAEECAAWLAAVPAVPRRNRQTRPVAAIMFGAGARAARLALGRRVGQRPTSGSVGTGHHGRGDR